MIVLLMSCAGWVLGSQEFDCEEGVRVANSGALQATLGEGRSCRVATAKHAPSPTNTRFEARGGEWVGIRFDDIDRVDITGAEASRLEWGASDTLTHIVGPTWQVTATGAGKIEQTSGLSLSCADCDASVLAESLALQVKLEGTSSVTACGLPGAQGELEAAVVDLSVPENATDGQTWTVRAEIAILRIGGSDLDIQVQANEVIRLPAPDACGDPAVPPRDTGVVIPTPEPPEPHPEPVVPPPGVEVELWSADTESGILLNLYDIPSKTDSYSFGLAQTEIESVGGDGWSGEDCFFGEPGTSFAFCHPIEGETLELYTVEAPVLLLPGFTTLISVDSPAEVTPGLTYVLLRNSDDRCWTWGHDVTYYTNYGCDIHPYWL